MTEEIAEIKERQERLEHYVNLLESRLDRQEFLMEFYSARQESVTLSDEEGAGDSRTANEPRLKEFDILLRSILTRQGMHNTDLRKVIWSQEVLRSSMENSHRRLNSIDRALLDVASIIQVLTNEPEAR